MSVYLQLQLYLSVAFSTNHLVGGAGNNTLQGKSTEDVTGPLSTLNAPRKEHLDTKELPSLQSKGNQNISHAVVTSDAVATYGSSFLWRSCIFSIDIISLDIPREDGADQEVVCSLE